MRDTWSLTVLAVTAAPTALEFPFPQVRTALWRDRRRKGPGTR